MKLTFGNSGGPAGLIYGFLLAWFGKLSVFITMGELSSMIPTAGGQYHWVNILAPGKSKKFLSYVTGNYTRSQPSYTIPNFNFPRMDYGRRLGRGLDSYCVLHGHIGSGPHSSK